MKMVGHEAVRNYCEPFSLGSVTDLRDDRLDMAAVREYRATIAGADRQEIPMKSGVVECFQPPG